GHLPRGMRARRPGLRPDDGRCDARPANRAHARGAATGPGNAGTLVDCRPSMPRAAAVGVPGSCSTPKTKAAECIGRTHGCTDQPQPEGKPLSARSRPHMALKRTFTD